MSAAMGGRGGHEGPEVEGAGRSRWDRPRAGTRPVPERRWPVDVNGCPRGGAPVAKSVVTPERLASGMTFEEYLVYIGSPENLAREGFGYYGGSFGAAPRKDNSTVIRERYTRARLAAHQREAITWLAAQPGGPARILVISEDWSSDCRRDVPMLARLAEAGKLELRIFNRDGAKILRTGRPDPATGGTGANHDLMLEFMNEKNGGEWASVPVAVGRLHEGLPGAASLHRVPRDLREGPDPGAPAGGPARQERGAGEGARHAAVRRDAGLVLLRRVGLRERRRDPERDLRAADRGLARLASAPRRLSRARPIGCGSQAARARRPP